LRPFHVYLFSAFVGDLLLPVFYIYLPLRGYELGANTLEVGLIGGAAYATYSFMPIVMGRFSDRLGSRILFIVFAFSILSVVSALYYFEATPVELIATRVFEGLGWAMLWPAIDAAISETGGGGASRALGIYNYIWSAAAALGPLLGAVLIADLSIRLAYATASAALALALTTNLVAIVTSPREPGEAALSLRLLSVRAFLPEAGRDAAGATTLPSDSEERTGATTRIPLWTRTRLSYMLCAAIGSMTAIVCLTFFPPYARSMGMPFFLIGVATLAYGVGRFSMFLLTSKAALRARILDRRNRHRKIVLGLLVASSSALIFTLRDPGGLLYVCAFALIGAGYAFAVTITQAALITEIPPGRMGTGAGIFESSLGMGSAVGPSVAGLVSGGSLRVPFLVPSFAFVVAVVILAGLIPRRGDYGAENRLGVV
jgi:MFS family permease